MDSAPLGGLLYELLNVADESGRIMAGRMGVGVSDAAAVQRLMTYGPAGPVDLGRALGMGSAAATLLADRLERSGHVERQPHPDDRRRLLLVPTEQAGQAVADVLQPLLARIAAVEADLDPAARATVAEYLRALIEAYRAYAAED